MVNRKINLIIIHCSDSNQAAHDDISVIREWHLARGWDDVGYHYYIKETGEIQKGREENVVGAHCYGYNESSIGICLGGKNIFTEEQFSAAIFLCKQLLDKYNLTALDILPHNKFNNQKTCPNFDVFDKIAKHLI